VEVFKIGLLEVQSVNSCPQPIIWAVCWDSFDRFVSFLPPCSRSIYFGCKWLGTPTSKRSHSLGEGCLRV